MKGIQIKINGQWIYLPEDFSISLEQTSPVFNEQGTFSFPFEIPLEPNRSVFKNIADPFGDISLRDIDKASAEIWFEGVLLYRGIIEVDEEIEIEDTIPVTFLSGNSDFAAQIDGVNAQDIPLDREINLGYALIYANWSFVYKGTYYHSQIGLPSNRLMVYSNVNVSDPYPIKPYCNVRICANTDNGKPVVMSAERPYSGVCFYVRYFLDCLFRYLNISVKEDNLGNMEDMNRLAFFNTRCEHVLSDSMRTVNYQKDGPMGRLWGGGEYGWYDNRGSFEKGRNIYFKVKVKIDKDIIADRWNGEGSYEVKDVFATQKNFPNCEVSEIIEALQTAFGVRFIFDGKQRFAKIIYIKDVFRSQDVIGLDCEIYQYKVIVSKNKKTILTYGKTDDTAFNYNDYSNSIQYNNYLGILKAGVNPYDLTRKIDAKTGNHYKVKVNRETGGDPSLFEVDGFKDYTIGEGEEEEQKINFSPVIVNDINGYYVKKEAANGREGQQDYAVFVSEEFKSGEIKYTPLPLINHSFSLLGKQIIESYITFKGEDNYDMNEEEESPLRTYDPGLVLGIMRGPGNQSGVEYEPNYDGEGNASWAQTVANYAFTSDSCDNFGRFFDYNGTEAGGADQTGRFSLKLIAGKDGYPIDSQYADRGLVSKFLSEYLYFMANKKTVVLTVRMNITQIIGIDFLKRYKIGDFVGFINKVSYTLDVNGVTDATIELYTL